MNRLSTIVAVAMILLLASGCRWPFGNTRPQQPVAFTGPATKEQIIAAVNANSSRVQQLESRLRLSVPGLPAITGDLAAEQPQRLRLQAGFMGTSAGGIDVGSNEELFWLWVKSALGGQRPAIYFARHDEYANSRARQAMPIDPSFLMDALGLYQFDATAVHEGPYSRPDGMIEMRSRTNTAEGESVHITVLDNRLGNLIEQHLYSRGRLVASSYASDFEYYPEQQVSLPKTIMLRALPNTQQELTLTINADKYMINQLYADPVAMWSMPRPDGVSIIDVSQADNPQFSLQKIGVPAYAPNYAPNSPAPQQADLRRYRGANLLPLRQSR